MRFKFGLVMGLAVGYYLGAMAGRQRYEQINRMLRRARESDTFGTASGKAKAALDLGVERARDLVESRTGNGAGGDDFRPPSSPTV